MNGDKYFVDKCKLKHTPGLYSYVKDLKYLKLSQPRPGLSLYMVAVANSRRSAHTQDTHSKGAQ